MNIGRLLGLVVIFDVVAALILYPHIDVFSGGYLVVSTALAILQAMVGRRLSKSEEIQRLFYAKDIDKAWDRWVAFLGLAELAVFFEYAHWRPVPELIRPVVQSAGLLLCIAGTLWLARVDSYLVEEFPAHFRRDALMTSGPYRLFRHPRYVGLFATRLALPLIFGSVIGWVLAIAWFILIRRRAHLEEQYLRSKFGQVYAEYAAHSMGML